jgi:hypothetical protein
MTTQTEGENTPMTSQEPEEKVRTVGPREGLGAGIIALGILSVALPAAVDQLPSVLDGGSAAFVLYGMSVLIGIFVIIAGVMTFFVKD